MNKDIFFGLISDKTPLAKKIKKLLIKKIKINSIKNSKIIIVIGGDGFMLQTLKKNKIQKSYFRN